MEQLLATAQDTAPRTDIPLDVLQSLLRAHVADQTAVITDFASTALPHQGTNDSTTFVHVSFTWSLAHSINRSHTASWVVKHWQAGGVRDSALGIAQPREVLAWERGWLRPDSLPPGLVVPFLGVWRALDNTEAWLAMADVSTELSTYSRMALSGDELITRANAILARLARFHAAWEQPERQAELHACSWLGRSELYLWEMAPTYAHALGRPSVAPALPGVYAPPVWDGLSADLHAFLEARPADERRLWEELLINRHAVVDGLAAYPQTLLHNDLDDRNIGLRWSGDGAVTEARATTPPDLVLIDWEWIALGPAAIDVANIVTRLPVMLSPGTAIPEAIWTDKFADSYFAHYRAAGGRRVDAVAWRRSFGLALVAHGVAHMPFLHGSMRRAIRGELPPPQIVGVPEAVVRQILQAGLPTMARMEDRVIGEARRWLGQV